MRGEVVHVALDVVPDTTRGGYRVLVRGVFTDPSLAPDPALDARRNLVGAFLDVPANGEPGAFWIAADPVPDDDPSDLLEA